MKNKGLLLLTIGFILLLLGTILNYLDYLQTPELKVESEKYEGVKLSQEHCSGDICISYLYIEKFYGTEYGRDYSIMFDIENKSNKSINDITINFVFETPDEKIKVESDEMISLEPEDYMSANTISEEVLLEDAFDYTFTYK